MPKKSPKDYTYADAKRIGRMTTEDIEIAKELKITPYSLIRCEWSRRTQSWKDPPGLWVRRLKDKNEKKLSQNKDKKGQ